MSPVPDLEIWALRGARVTKVIGRNGLAMRGGRPLRKGVSGGLLRAPRFKEIDCSSILSKGRTGLDAEHSCVACSSHATQIYSAASSMTMMMAPRGSHGAGIIHLMVPVPDARTLNRRPRRSQPSPVLKSPRNFGSMYVWGFPGLKITIPQSLIA